MKTGCELIQSRSREANQQLGSDRRRGLLLPITAAAVAPSSSSVVVAAAAAEAAAVVVRRPPADEAPLLLDALRDRNAAAGMFVNETARGCSSRGIMVQPCRS